MEEGPIYAMCMAGQGDQATLSQWISGLQETCPILGQIPTVFRLESGPRELQTSSDAQQTPKQEVEIDQIIEEEPQRSQGVNQWESFHNAMHFIKNSMEIYQSMVVIHESKMMKLIELTYPILIDVLSVTHYFWIEICLHYAKLLYDA